MEILPAIFVLLLIVVGVTVAELTCQRWLRHRAPIILRTVNQPDWRLAAVVEEMRRLGPPTLYARREPWGWQLLEGSHRAVAAMRLGYPITLREAPADLRVCDVANGWGYGRVRRGELTAYPDTHPLYGVDAGDGGIVLEVPADRVRVPARVP
jgi:hypothetical protein